MNSVSIIINGVRCDAVYIEHPRETICDKCDLKITCDALLEGESLCRIFGLLDYENVIFKKSTKSFEP